MDGSSSLKTVNPPVLASKPVSIHLLLILVFLVSAYHLTRFGQSLIRWSFLSEVLPFTPAYLALNGALWGLAGLIFLWAIWKRKDWMPQALRASLVLYSVNYWFERIVLAGTTLRNVNWLFAAFLNLVIVLSVLGLLQRKSVKGYFGVKHDE